MVELVVILQATGISSGESLKRSEALPWQWPSTRAESQAIQIEVERNNQERMSIRKSSGDHPGLKFLPNAMHPLDPKQRGASASSRPVQTHNASPTSPFCASCDVADDEAIIACWSYHLTILDHFHCFPCYLPRIFFLVARIT